MSGMAMSGMARGCIAMRCAATSCVAALRTGPRARAHMHAFTRAHSHASARVPVRGRIARTRRDASFFIYLRGPSACV